MKNILCAYVNAPALKFIHRNIDDRDIQKNGMRCYYNTKGVPDGGFIPLFENVMRRDMQPIQTPTLALKLLEELTDFKEKFGQKNMHPTFVPGEVKCIERHEGDLLVVEANPGFLETNTLCNFNTALHRAFPEFYGTPKETYTPRLFLECLKPGLGKVYAEKFSEGVPWMCLPLTRFYLELSGGYSRPLIFDTISGRIRGPWVNEADLDNDDDDVFEDD